MKSRYATAGWGRETYHLLAGYLTRLSVALSHGEQVNDTFVIEPNGNLAGYIGYRPYELDVTKWIKPGANQVEVIVIGTLKNTLGPHHAGKALGFVGPHSFLQAPAVGPPPGRKYQTLEYGLFEPFVLEQAVFDPLK